MERSIRIGKDFNVLWSIHKVVDGERLPYELAGKELELQYRTPYGIKKATEWVAEGNTIIWTFRGKEQKALGLYGLILTENRGKDGMVTVDTCKAFKLVAHSCEETEGSGNDVVIDVVVLESEVAFAPVATGGGGGSYDDTAIKEDIAELQENDRQIVEALVQFGEAVETLGKNDQTIGESIASLQEKDEEIMTGLAQLGEKVAELEESGTGGGTSPSFTSVEVSVDDTTGDPRAEAEIDGNTLKIDFFGLKGEQGPQGPQGPQGNSGYQGAAGELEIVNNLIDGGATAALSAEQGKVIGDNLIEYRDIKEELTWVRFQSNRIRAHKSDMSYGRIMLKIADDSPYQYAVSVGNTASYPPNSIIYDTKWKSPGETISVDLSGYQGKVLVIACRASNDGSLTAVDIDDIKSYCSILTTEWSIPRLKSRLDKAEQTAEVIEGKLYSLDDKLVFGKSYNNSSGSIIDNSGTAVDKSFLSIDEFVQDGDLLRKISKRTDEYITRWNVCLYDANQNFRGRLDFTDGDIYVGQYVGKGYYFRLIFNLRDKFDTEDIPYTESNYQPVSVIKTAPVGVLIDDVKTAIADIENLIVGAPSEDVVLISNETITDDIYLSYNGGQRGFFVVKVGDVKSWSAEVSVAVDSPIKVGVQGSYIASLGGAKDDTGWITAGKSDKYDITGATLGVAYVQFVFTYTSTNTGRPTIAEIKEYISFSLVANGYSEGLIDRVAGIETELGIQLSGMSYDGEKINLRSNIFTSETIGKLSAGTSSRQGGAVFGDYLFQFHNTLATIVVYNLAKKTNVQVLNLAANANCHAGSGGFGNEYADASDPFPLLYISSMDEKKVYVYRITGTEGSWSIALVQTLTLEIDFYVPNVAIDRENNMMVIFGYTKNSWRDSVDNPSHIISCPIPKLAAGDITVNEWSHGNTIPYIYAQQGAFARFGKLYLSYGETTQPFGGGAYVIDYVQGIAVSHIDFKQMGSFEPEAFCKYGDKIVMTDQNGNIYGLSF